MSSECWEHRCSGARTHERRSEAERDVTDQTDDPRRGDGDLHEQPTRAAWEQERDEPDPSRVSVVNEPGPEGDDDEFAYHTGQRERPHGTEDAIEFVDVHKAFGRNKILRGLNMGLPEDRISMILGPSGTGKSVCIKHMVGLLYPDEGDVLV